MLKALFYSEYLYHLAMPFQFHPNNNMFLFYRWQIVDCVSLQDQLCHLCCSFCCGLFKLDNKMIFQDGVANPYQLGSSYQLQGLKPYIFNRFLSFLVFQYLVDVGVWNFVITWWMLDSTIALPMFVLYWSLWVVGGSSCKKWPGNAYLIAYSRVTLHVGFSCAVVACRGKVEFHRS